jgi:hypothetical protein
MPHSRKRPPERKPKGSGGPKRKYPVIISGAGKPFKPPQPKPLKKKPKKKGVKYKYRNPMTDRMKKKIEEDKKKGVKYPKYRNPTTDRMKKIIEENKKKGITYKYRRPTRRKY